MIRHQCNLTFVCLAVLILLVGLEVGLDESLPVNNNLQY